MRLANQESGVAITVPARIVFDDLMFESSERDGVDFALVVGPPGEGLASHGRVIDDQWVTASRDLSRETKIARRFALRAGLIGEEHALLGKPYPVTVAKDPAVPGGQAQPLGEERFR